MWAGAPRSGQGAGRGMRLRCIQGCATSRYATHRSPPAPPRQQCLTRLLPGTKRLELHEEQPPAAARAERFAAKNAPAGQRQIRTISVRSVRAGHWDDHLPAPASASGSGKNGFGRFTVNAACCVDLFWIYRGSLPLSTPWPWRRPVAAVPIPPCPVTRGRRA